MYKWKSARRSETDSLHTFLLVKQIEERADHVISLGVDRFGRWYKIQLPAGVVALLVRNDKNTTVGYFHVGYEADLEFKNRHRHATKTPA